ncbi:DNA-binding protein [Acidovorax sp.]|uniref:DNA-binding protein n=1 Tax=Acidovorax sp. TaxID=1872122 RepID=UPI003BB1B39E
MLRTPSEAQAWLERHGVTASEWARAHGFAPSVVFALLSGRTHGRRGQAHRAAVALGLKCAAPDEETSPLADVPSIATASTSSKSPRANQSISHLAGGSAMT